MNKRGKVRGRSPLRILGITLILAVLLGAGGFAIWSWHQTAMINRAHTQGLAAFERQDWDKAATMLGRWLSRHREDVDVLRKYACAQRARRPVTAGNLRQAINAYREILRVLAPGGRLCILEFGTGKARIWQGMYNFYLGTVLPRIGRFFSKNPEAYQDLADTILAFPDARALAAELAQAGFDQIGYQALSSGIVYIHVGRKPV